jgi:hypothetical protein
VADLVLVRSMRCCTVACSILLASAAPLRADSSWDEQLRWRHRFLLAADEQLGTAADVQQIREAMLDAGASAEPNFGPMRWISRSVVGVRADQGRAKTYHRVLFIVEKHEGHWIVTHAYRFLPTYL